MWSATSTFRIDTRAPSTSDNTQTLQGGWYRTAQTVTLSPIDPGGSGIQGVYFTTDGSIPTTGSRQGTSITLDLDGVYRVRYFAVDRAGNTEAVRTADSSVRIDQTAPDAVKLRPTPEVIVDGQEFTASGSDAQSGVARVTYEYCPMSACDAWTPLGSSTNGPDYAVEWRQQPADGPYWIRVRMIDQAGNVTTSDPRSATVDNSPPQEG
jgi:hypothetical protein